MEDEPKNEYCPEWGYRQHWHMRHAGWTTFIIPKDCEWSRVGDFEIMIHRRAGPWTRFVRLSKAKFKTLVSRHPTPTDLTEGES